MRRASLWSCFSSFALRPRGNRDSSSSFLPKRRPSHIFFFFTPSPPPPPPPPLFALKKNIVFLQMGRYFHASPSSRLPGPLTMALKQKHFKSIVVASIHCKSCKVVLFFFFLMHKEPRGSCFNGKKKKYNLHTVNRHISVELIKTAVFFNGELQVRPSWRRCQYNSSCPHWLGW